MVCGCCYWHGISNHLKSLRTSNQRSSLQPRPSTTQEHVASPAGPSEPRTSSTGRPSLELEIVEQEGTHGIKLDQRGIFAQKKQVPVSCRCSENVCLNMFIWNEHLYIPNLLRGNLLETRNLSKLSSVSVMTFEPRKKTNKLFLSSILVV